jgi:tubulin-specific chaperone D
MIADAFDLEETISVKESMDCEKNSFAEKDHFLNRLKNYLEQAPTESELERFLTILDTYQEKPQLLDPVLGSIISPIVDQLLNIMLEKRYDQIEPKNHLFKILYRISKTRGHKVIVKFFTHEASHLEPAIDFYEHISSQTHFARFWEMRFMSLLWISLICMIPFDLERIDSMVGSDKLVDRILNIAKQYLNCVGKEYEGASILATRLLTRKDCSRTHLFPFIEWQVEQLKNASSTFHLRGHLRCLAGIFKLGSRELLLASLGLVWPVLEIGNFPSIKNNSLLRKLYAKLVSRIALACMKHRVASWRYSRGPRILAHTLAGVNPDIQSKANIEEEDEYHDIPDEIETVLTVLLEYLCDKDTIVRWTAAKGIGRICNRLDRDLADQVVSSVIDLIQEDVIVDTEIQSADVSITTDSTWHGSCLALAELTRRGLLLPNRLYDAIPWITRALTYELKKGTHSLGSNVRDAACYAVWSIARAYDASVIEPFARSLSQSLVVVSLTDREVAVRRAASAAFQENAGRHGLFPDGISVVTTADYFSLGIRANCFENVTIQVAQYESYRKCIVEHLVYQCVSHWDKNVRELASKSLGKLTELYPSDEYISKYIPDLIELLNESDIDKHGGFMAIGEIVAGLSIGIPRFWEKNPSLLNQLQPLLGLLTETHLNTFGSDLIRQGACKFIYCVSKSGFLSYSNDSEMFRVWFGIINTTLYRSEEVLYPNAANALSELLLNRPELLSADLFDLYISKIVPSGDRYARRGVSFAFSLLPAVVVVPRIDELLNALVKATKIQSHAHWNDAESKRNAVHALTSLSTRIDSHLFVENPSLFSLLLDCFLIGMEDYSVDSRGDVGSWIRDASMIGLEALFNIAKCRSIHLTENQRLSMVGYILLSCSEKIDKVRETGGRIITKLLKDQDVFIPNRNLLEIVFDQRTEFNWLVPKTVYPLIVKLLHCSDYRDQVMKGIAISIGGLTESLVRHSSDALVNFLFSLPCSIHSSYPPTTVQSIFESILNIFQENIQNDRVSIPLLETLDLLISSGFLDPSFPDQLIKALFDTLKKEVLKSKNTKKLIAAIKV